MVKKNLLIPMKIMGFSGKRQATYTFSSLQTFLSMNFGKYEILIYLNY